MKTIRESSRRAALAAAVTASAVAASLLAGAPAATATDAPTEVPVAADGTVATDPGFGGPQVTELRVINEGKFLEISWDRYVDEVAAVSPENVTLTSGGDPVELVEKPATGPTDTIFFDRENRQIAASDANSMERLPEDLHLASIAYRGTIDPNEPLTLTIDGSQIADAEGRAARDVTYTGVPRLDYYTQSVTTGSGITVKAGPRVEAATLDLAASQVDVQLGKADNGIAARMADFGCSLAVYAARENAYLVPEHRGGYDPEMYDVEGYGGSEWNGCVSSISERNVLRTRGDANAFLNTGYPNENILVHEFGHAVRLVGIETLADPGLSDELYAAYENSWSTGRWPNTYAIGNIDEYFATLSAIWFDVMAEKPDWTDGVRSPINTRAELKEYDPQAYELFAKVYPADLTLPAPWDEPAPDVHHGDYTQLPERPERAAAEDVDFAADTFRIVTDGIGTEYQVDRYAGDGDHPERDMVVWSRWGDGVWSLAPAGGGAYTIAASDGSGALAAVSDTEVRYAGVAEDADDPRQRWTFVPDASTEAEPYDGRLVNAATGGALDVDGRTTSGVSLTLTDPAEAIRWLLEDTTRTAAQGVGAYLVPDVTAPEVMSAWAHPNRKSLTLEAADDASGVALVEYRVGDGGWTTYRGTVRVGPRDRVEARATDRAGNVSPVLVVDRH
ncbi:RICIN domain-containing protein [Isoptericola sp. 4D.3]|uniref:RICIN domain-containing protein n=1 Tax=Isoptericola peretonis TaxID=2918523 RepID=A0ABT0J479_9MICO|nr:RICIN domain-containing protein [Isoptericola sp. 4D.3]